MTALLALVSANPDAALTAGGLLIGLLFGALASATNFCTMGAISDWQSAGSTGRLGAVALAAATAIIGAQLLDAAGVTDLSKSVYLNPRLNWLGGIAGGLLFGGGMVYAGGCPSRSLVRAGSGDLRAIVSLIVLAIAAYATISGVFGSLRVGLDGATALDVKRFGAATQSLTDLTGLTRVVAAALVASPLLLFAIARGGVLSEPGNLVAGLGVGLLAVGGWLLTGLAHDEFAASPVPPASLSFVRPVADAIDWIERSTALGLPGFGAASVFGVLIGAFMASAMTGRLNVAAFADQDDLKRHILGAAAMGIGGVLALGCSIGQGITGLSTLSVQSILAAAAIFAGAVLGLKRLERSL